MEECLSSYRAHSPHPLPPEWLHTAGILELSRGDAEAAERYLREGLEPYLAQAESATLPIAGLILLDGLAIAAARRGDPVRALRLAAAATALRRTRRLQLGVTQERELQQAVAAARADLGPDAARRADESGSRLSESQALRYAVRDVWQESGRADAGSPLTERERQVAELVAAGLTNREIAARIYVAERTVESHLEHIRDKLHLRSRSQVAAWATRSRETGGDAEA
jgi:non-specific serine/threonine protein kinase